MVDHVANFLRFRRRVKRIRREKHNAASRRHGRKPAVRERRKARYEASVATPEGRVAHNARVAKWRADHPERWRAHAAKYDAKRRADPTYPARRRAYANARNAAIRAGTWRPRQRKA